MTQVQPQKKEGKMTVAKFREANAGYDGDLRTSVYFFFEMQTIIIGPSFSFSFLNPLIFFYVYLVILPLFLINFFLLSPPFSSFPLFIIIFIKTKKKRCYEEFIVLLQD